MKILHVCAVGFTVKNLLLPQINFLLDKGLEVEIACAAGDTVAELQELGYTIHAFPIERKIAPLSNLRSIVAMVRLMKHHRYDLVHVHTPVASVLGRVSAKIAGIPRVVYTAHGFYFHDNMPPQKYRFYHQVETISGWLTDKILTQSREDLETAKRTNLCPPDKLSYLGNGIDLYRFSSDRLCSKRQSELKLQLKIPVSAFPVLAMTGRITEEKGYLELINALSILQKDFPSIHLVIIGGQLESERDAFQAKLHRLILDRRLESHVTFTGFRSDVPEVLGLVDLFVLPSYREGLPRSILEAMAMSLPVVATDIRGCREAIEDGETGLIVPPRDSEKLAQAVRKILQDSDYQAALGAAALNRAKFLFDEKLVFERLKSVYQELGVL